MALWLRWTLTIVGFVSVLGLIGIQLYTRTAFLTPEHSIDRSRQPVHFWVVISLQLFLVAASVAVAVAQFVLGM